MRLRPFDPDGVRSILVMRLYFVGDMLLATPVLEALRRRFPRASLTVLLKRRARAVLEGNPHVDRILEYDGGRGGGPVRRWRLSRRLGRERFDLAVDLTGDLRTSWLLFASSPGFRVGFNHAGLGFLLDRSVPYRADGHVVDHLLSAVEGIGAVSAAPVPRMYLSDEERDRGREVASSVGLADGEFAVLSPGANWEFRRWPSERYAALAREMRDRRGLVSVVTGSAGDAPLTSAIAGSSDGAAVSLAGAIDLREFAAVASLARIFVGNDSGPMHIAAAVGTPVVAIFGPNTPKLFEPRGSPSRVLWRQYPCGPCSQRACVRPGDPCVAAIGLDEVTAAVESLLDETEER